MKRLFSMAQAALLTTGLLVLPSFAQAPGDPTQGADPTMPRQTDMDDDFNLGWLGLLGLAGLIGLRKRPHTHTNIDDVRRTGTDRI